MPPIAAFASVPAPWGTIHVAVTGAGIVSLSLDDQTADFADALSRRLHGHVVPAEDAAVPAEWRSTLEDASAQIAEYLAGSRRTFDLPIDLRVSDWDRLVLSGAAQVPYGETIGYGELARRIGHPGANQAVGGAMGRNPIGLLIPCHRVVAKSDLGGYGGSTYADREHALSLKRALLQIEGSVAGGPPKARSSSRPNP